MALTKELSLQGQQSNFAHRPLGLSPNSPVFNSHGELVGLSDEAPRMTSLQLAQAAIFEAEALQIESLGRKLASSAMVGLSSGLLNQVGRNSLYNQEETLLRLKEQYPDNHEQIIYGTAHHGQIVEAAITNPDHITSLEVARLTHLGEWRLGQSINDDVRAEVQADPGLRASWSKEAPKFKIKGFHEGSITVERKRDIFELLGGEAVLVMRLSFLLDESAPDMPTKIARLINSERSRQGCRELGDYDFEKENELLSEMLEEAYIQTPIKEGGKPGFVIPGQSSYYVYSREAHSNESCRQEEEAAARRAREAKNRVFWRSDWA